MLVFVVSDRSDEMSLVVGVSVSCGFVVISCDDVVSLSEMVSDTSRG